MSTVSLKCLETRTRVLTYYKEHSKESTRCKTEHSDESINILQRTQWGKYKMQNRAQWCKTKMQVTLYFESQWVYRQVYLHHIIQNLVYLFRKEIFLFIIWIIIFIVLLVFTDNDNIPYSKALKKTDFSFIWRFGAFSLKQQPENGPCKLTSPWVAGKFQETGPFMESVSFPQYCDVH